MHRTVGKAVGRALVRALVHRSDKIYGQIEPFIGEGTNVLDLGCGDGKVGELVHINKNSNVILADIDNFLKVQLPFHRYDGRTLPFADNFFDHVLLLTVLHHSDDPERVFEEALRVTNKSVIVIESVYFNNLHRGVNKFLDWFYNRVLNSPEVTVPFNFLSPDAWVMLFEMYVGRVIHMEHLGLDQPLVPEWHTLYVIEKKFYP
ncbi:class I SAM-dependent methyltransferase [Candidatus Micrarchaeota archaeon]|nr:class I SAM-dependent methyltransferase [Candidatus Micrarchaeota archaeon]